MRAVAPQLQPEDEFAASREQFTQMEAFLMSDEAHSKTHSELERELEQQGRELLRRLYQAHLELHRSRSRGRQTRGVRSGYQRRKSRPVCRPWNPVVSDRRRLPVCGRPEEVMRVLAPQPQREEGKRPRPQHKRLWAS